ncbi:hypothetical protein [Micromonospora sp. SL4-19]|uniref:hypothetical protein n=1 Tax=Micromonospora sp. SL4-19 TaxID=3399129 RepID=UPI003A4E3E1C
MTEGLPSNPPPPAPRFPVTGPYLPPAQAAPAGPYPQPVPMPAAPDRAYPPPFPPPAGPYGAPGYPPPPGFGPPGPYGPPPVPPPARKKSKRWLWISLTAVVVVLALCGGSLTALKLQLDKRNAAEAAQHPIKPAEIEALLAGHTRALKDRDLAAFTAPFDQKLVAQQTRLFRNLVKVPFAEARFVKFRQGEFASVGEGWTVELTLSFVHRFAYDLAPVDELYTWTVVRAREGAPLTVTTVGHLPEGWRASELSYYPAPWDKWRNLHVEKTEHTVLMVDASLRAEAQRYAPAAERAAVADLAAWRAGGVSAKIPQGFVLSLVKGEKEMASIYQTGAESNGESGLSMPFQPTSTDKRYEDRPGVGGSRVLVDVTDPYFFRSGDPDLPPALFRHEFAHSMVANVTDHDREEFNLDGLQNWVVEGFAEYLGHERRSWMRSDLTDHSRAMLPARQDDLALPSNDTWATKGRVSYHYWLGHSAMSFIADRYDNQRVFELVETHYRGKKIEDAVQQVLGLSHADFEKQWSAYVIAKTR